MALYKEKILKSSRTFLSRWNGEDARFLEMTTPHASLRIRITSRNKTGNLFICCIGPVYICGPVVDDGVGMKIVTCAVEVKEHVKPLTAKNIVGSFGKRIGDN